MRFMKKKIHAKELKEFEKNKRNAGPSDNGILFERRIRLQCTKPKVHGDVLAKWTDKEVQQMACDYLKEHYDSVQAAFSLVPRASQRWSASCWPRTTTTLANLPIRRLSVRRRILSSP